LPPIHELAKQAGIDLPEYMGELRDMEPEAKKEEPAK